MKAEELDALIERVEKATGPDREIDLALGKALGLVPADAAWKPAEDIFAALFPKREWELPSYTVANTEWNRRVKAFIGSPEYYADKDGQWMTDNPPPHHGVDWANAPVSGHVPNWSASIDAALALMERVLPGIWYVMAKGRLTESEPLFACELLFGEVQQSIADGPTPSLAIILATLRALRSIRGGKP